jgi:hypothetical protein
VRALKRDGVKSVARYSVSKVKKSNAGERRSLKIAHRRNKDSTIRELNRILFPAGEHAKAWTPNEEEKSDQAARPISISPLNALLRLHA